MDKDSAFYYLHELEDDMFLSIFYEWEKAKGDPNKRQNWNVIPKGLLIKEWQYFSKTNLVHDSAIQKIEKFCIDNYWKIR